jgi:hypothetical protein
MISVDYLGSRADRFGETTEWYAFITDHETKHGYVASFNTRYWESEEYRNEFGFSPLCPCCLLSEHRWAIVAKTVQAMSEGSVAGKIGWISWNGTGYHTFTNKDQLEHQPIHSRYYESVPEVPVNVAEAFQECVYLFLVGEFLNERGSV